MEIDADHFIPRQTDPVALAPADQLLARLRHELDQVHGDTVVDREGPDPDLVVPADADQAKAQARGVGDHVFVGLELLVRLS